MSSYDISDVKTFKDFYRFVQNTISEARRVDLRSGQHAMNALRVVKPEFYIKITNWYPVDPFYRDQFLPRFWEELEKMWNGTSVDVVRQRKLSDIDRETITSIIHGIHRDIWKPTRNTKRQIAKYLQILLDLDNEQIEMEVNNQ